uniref:non-specific serine/threonine protein kinase n=1 Tax=Micromonas pusilla TaxID=38833 RepID=A0A7S0KVM2_MICPS
MGPEFDESLAGQFGSFSQQRALQQAAGRWVIPPQELKLGRRIGSGSFGVVYTADWNGTEVALKQMHNKSLSASNVQEFSGEIRMMQGMRHPNIVLFLGAVIQAPRLSIVCELMPLGSLHALLHGKTQNGVELATNGRLRRQMAQDCARGMSYLHSRSPPVVHHDLKPANLLVDSHWTLKVSDFGMSRLKHNTYLSSKSPGGTPEWMAPEVLRNDPTDERSDVYSFAVILWELITLKYPWEELSSPVQIVVQVAFLHRRPKLPTWLPAEAVALLQQCWHKDPDERPAFSAILGALKAEMPEAWVDQPTESPKAAAFAELARKEQPFSGPISPQRPRRRDQAPSPSGSVNSVNSLASSVNGSLGGSLRSASPSIEGNFVTLTGLKPIKTPKPAKKKGSSALGPNHMSEDDRAGNAEDDDDDDDDNDGVFKGFPGMGRVKVPGTARSAGSVDASELRTPPMSPSRSAPGSSTSGGVKSPDMAAAAGVLPKLSPLKIVRKLPTK